MTVNWNPGPTTARIVQGARQAVVQATEGVLDEGNRLIASPPKTGRVYRRGGVDHQASAPGEAPAADTGALMQSGQAFYPAAGDSMIIRGVANWSSGYAAALELGSSNTSAAPSGHEDTWIGAVLEYGTERVAPRPYARPALDHIGPSFPADLAFRIGGTLR